jgi:monoterpene epsilon-lactone hydrolase
MSIVITLILVIVFIWLIGFWLGRGEDLARFDQPVDPAAFERFGQDSGPSAEHCEAENGIRAMGGQVRAMSRKQMLQFTRDFMEEMPAGREFDCEFRAVDAGGVPAEWVLAPGADPARRVLYIHGGAFIAGSPQSHRTITSRYSAETGAAVLAIDYRLMPENRRKYGIEDCRTAYRWILQNGPEGPAEPRRLYVSGDSAGGNLSLVISAWARDAGLRKPDAVIALSPLTDSAYASPSLRGNLQTDTMLGPLFGALMKIPRPLLAWFYFLETRFRQVDPEVSPLRGDLSNLPPTLIQVSEAEMLLDDARRYVIKARACGSPARLQSWAGLLHVWQIFNPEVPEALQAFSEIGQFIRSVEATGG